MERYDWKDRYERLQEEHLKLKKSHRTLKEELKRQNAKLRNSQSYEIVDGKSQHETIRTMTSENQELIAKCRALELRLARLGRATPYELSTHRSFDLQKKAMMMSKVHKETQTEQSNDESSSRGLELNEKAIGLIDALRCRLGELEINLSRLTKENLLLMEASYSNQDDRPSKADVQSDKSVEEIEATMRLSTFDVALLEKKYADLKEQLRASKAIQSQTLTKLQTIMEENLEAKVKITSLSRVQSDLESRERMVHDLRQEILMQRNESIKLHETVHQLTNRPFIDNSTNLQTLLIQVADLEGQLELLTAQLANETQHAKILNQQNKSLKKQVVLMQEKAEKAIKEEVTLRLQFSELQLQYDMLVFQTTLAKEPTNELLVHALAHATKQAFQPSKVDFLLENKDTSQQSAVHTVNDDMKRFVGHATAKELAKYKQTASIFEALNGDLDDELKRLRSQHAKELSYWKAQYEHASSCKTVHQQQISELQEKLKALQHTKICEDINDENMNEMVVEFNLLDIAIPGSRDSYFLVCEYADFESQLSNVVVPPTKMDFQLSYKCVIDRAFFDSVYIRLELHRLDISRDTLQGIGLLSLQSLYASSHGVLEQLGIPFTHPRNGSHVGDVFVDIRLRKPVDRHYKKIPLHDDRILQPALPMILEISLLSLLWPTAMDVAKRSSGSIVFNFLGYNQVSIPFELNPASSYAAIARTRQFPVLKTPQFIKFIKRYHLRFQVEWSDAESHPYSADATAAVVPLGFGSTLASVAVDIPGHTNAYLALQIEWYPAQSSMKQLDRYLIAMCIQFQDKSTLSVHAPSLTFSLFSDGRFLLYRNRILQDGELVGMEKTECDCYLATLTKEKKTLCHRLFQMRWNRAWLDYELEIRRRMQCQTNETMFMERIRGNSQESMQGDFPWHAVEGEIISILK